MLKIGIVGLGYWGKHYIRILSENKRIKLVAVCDLNNELLNKYSYLNVEKYNDYLEMIKSKKIDSIIIITIASIHKKIIIDSLKYNLNIFVEKPYTLNLKDCMEIEKNINKNTKLMIGHTYLYSNKINYVKHFIDNEMKNIKTIQFTWTGSGYHPNDTTPIFDLSVHPLSILLYLFPNHEIMNIHSLKSTSNNTYFLQFKINKIIVHMNISWSSPGKTRKMILNDDKLKLIFDDVTNTDPIKILYTDDNNSNNNIFIHSDGKKIIPQIKNNEPLTDQFNDWIDYSENKIEIISNHEFAKEIVELCEKFN